MFGIGRIREHFARVERKIDLQAKAQEKLFHLMEEQRRQLGEQQARGVSLEGHLSSTATELAAQTNELQSALSILRSEFRESFDSLEPTLTKLRGRDKHRRGEDKRLAGEVRALLRQAAQFTGASYGSFEPRFHQIAQPLVEGRRTMLGYDRLLTLWQAAGNVAHLKLPAVEVGTFQGGSAALIAQSMLEAAGEAVPLHVVDTFEGHLDDTFSTHDDEIQRGKFQSVRYEDVRAFLSQFEGIQVYRGDVSHIVPAWSERLYALIHIDVDLYRPTLDCLEYFWPRLALGGIVVMDDYQAPSCPGVSRAVHEYLSRTRGFQRWRLQSEQLVLIKTGV